MGFGQKSCNHEIKIRPIKGKGRVWIAKRDIPESTFEYYVILKN